MKTRIVFALCVSLFFIGGATWFRFTNTANIVSNIELVERPDPQVVSREILDAFISTSTPTENRPLSDTDVIARQLIIDYINLATSGGASDEAVNTLAEKYVETIPSIASEAPSIRISDIQLVDDTLTNFQTYANQALEIYASYAQAMASVSLEESVNFNNPAVGPSAKALGVVYKNTAEKLQNINVPVALSQEHIRLVNNYLTSSVAMTDLSELGKDPAKSFAGILAINKSLNEEGLILQNIEKILTDNGV